MSAIELKRFGLNLSGRAEGMSALAVIKSEHQAPFVLDFSEVFSIGSSFADEVVVPLARLNGNNSIEIKNANVVIKKCLKNVSDESGISIS